jgi:hypothetical protein
MYQSEEGPVVVAYICNPRYVGGGGRRMEIQDLPRQKPKILTRNKLKE